MWYIYIALSFVLVGSLFCLIAAIGVLRMPDIYTRIHAASKAGTLGLILIFTGCFLYFFSWAAFLRMIAIIFFIFLAMPVSSHILGLTALQARSPKWKNTIIDESEHY
ncbi:MAG: monovalent cation/H(+) antiporter subunit G [Alphaproteobacteria bacterium]|nr:monovalent cation/H(+) antiporter subunit G [Alphaproteobacteria bacterium]